MCNVEIIGPNLLIYQSIQILFRFKVASFFLLPVLNRALSKMKNAQWGFSFKKSNKHFLKQLCLYFNYLMGTV